MNLENGGSNMKYKKIFLFILIGLLSITLVSCGNNKNQEFFIENVNSGSRATINLKSISDLPTSSLDSIDSSAYYKSITEYSINLSDLSNLPSGVTFVDNNLTIKNEGNYTLTGTLNGTITVKGSAEYICLILDNATINSLSSQTASPISFKEHTGIRTIYVKENTTNYLCDSIGDTEESGDGAVIKAKKSSLVIMGSGKLVINTLGEDTNGIQAKNELYIFDTQIEIDATNNGIKSGTSLIIKNANILIESNNDGIKTDIEITSTNNSYQSDPFAGYIYIYNTDINITASDDGISACSYLKIDNSTHEINIITNGGTPYAITESSSNNANGKAIKVDGLVLEVNNTETDLASKTNYNYLLVILSGVFNLNSNDDAIHSKGNTYITGGSFNITSGNDGIHSEYTTNISNGTINITKSYEAIEGATVEILDGTINVVAYDDGINAANSSLRNYAYYIYISGGTITVNAQGDGIDSNGTIQITGGTTIVYGPSKNGNCGLDSEKGIFIDGGNVVVFSVADMIESPQSSSNRPSIVYSTGSTVSTNTTFQILDGSKVIFETKVPKSYQCVIASLTDFSLNNTYTLKFGSTSTSVTLSSNVTSNTNSMMGGMPGGMGGPGRR